MNNQKLAKQIVEFLNEIFKIDPAAVISLVETRFACNDKMADHSTVQVAESTSGYVVGLLGILNGICGVQENGMGFIAVIYEDDKIVGFKLLTR